MKTSCASLLVRFWLLSSLLLATAQAAIVTKAATGTDLTSGASWGGTAPTAADTATWSGTSLGAGLTLGSAASWQGVTVTGAASNIVITGAGPLTLGSGGINMAGATVNATLGSPLNLAAGQIWKVATARTLTSSGVISGNGALTIGSAPPTVNYSLYLSNNSSAPSVAFPGVALSSIVAVGGTMNGNWIVSSKTATTYFFTNNGSTATYQLQFHDDSYTKVVKVQLTQAGADVVAYQVYAKYKSGNFEGQNFDTITPDGSPPVGSAGYGVESSYAQTGITPAGTVLLAGADNHTGTTTISSGTLRAGGPSALGGNSALTIASTPGATLNLNGFNNSIGSLAGAGTVGLGNGTLTTGGTNTNTSFSGIISGTGGGFTKTGSGTQTLSGDNTYTGTTTVSGGTLELNNSTGSVYTYSGGTLFVNGPSTFRVTGTGSSNRYDFLGKTFSFDSVGGGRIDLPSVGMNIVFALDNNVTNTILTNGGARNNISGGSGLNLGGSSTDRTIFNIVRGSDPTSDLDVGVELWNGGSVVKTGSGILSLGVYNSYTGTTTVSGGRLAVNGSLSSGSAVTVNATGTLGGTGIINGPVTLGAAGTLAPGAATPGTLMIHNTLTLNATSNVAMRINKSGATLTSDRIAMTGTTGIAYTGTLTVSATGDPLAGGDRFTLFSKTAGTFNGGFLTTNLPALGTGLVWDTSSLTTDGSIQVLTVGAVTNPSFSLAAGGYLGQRTVTLSCGTAGATIYYTTDGTTPTHASAVYASAITIPVNTTLTIKALAAKTGLSDSGVASASYVTQSSATWSNPAGGLWPIAGNWLNSVIGQGSGVNAYFNALTLTDNPLVTIDSPVTIGGLAFGDVGNQYSWTLNQGSGSLTLDGVSPPVIQVDNQSATITAPLAGSTGLAKSGMGTLTLSGANTYSGPTAVNLGTLRVGNGGSHTGLSASSTEYAIGSGASLLLDYDVVGTGSSSDYAPTWAKFKGAGTLELKTPAAAAVAAVHWGPVALSAGFTGTLKLTNNGRINGTPGNFGSTGMIVVGSGAQFLAYDGATNGTTYNFTQNLVLDGFGWAESGHNYGALRVSGMAATFSGNISLVGSSGSTGLYSQNQPGTSMTLAGAVSGTNALTINDYRGSALGSPCIFFTGSNNTHTGTTTVAIGYLVARANNALSASSAMTVNSGAKLWLHPVASGTGYNNAVASLAGAGSVELGNGTLTTGGNNANTTFSGIISGSGGGVTKIGSGTQTLSAANTYTGSTIVAAGTLLVNGTLASSPVTVAAGATLGGTGILGGPTTVSGLLTPGTNGVGTLTVNNALAQAATSKTLMEISKSGGTATFDRVLGVTSLTQGGTLTVTASGEALLVGDSFRLFTATTYSGAFATVNLPAGYVWDTSQLKTNGTIAVTGINQSPVFGGYAVATPYQKPVSLLCAKLLAKASDPDGDALSVTTTGPTSANGGTAVLQGSSILYTPANNFSGADTFPVTITDARGASVIGTMMVTVGSGPSAGGVGGNPPVLAVLPDGKMGLAFQGIPGRSYIVQRSASGLDNWVTLATIPADASGKVSYTDESPPAGSAFYRLGLP
jgi:autotransporter-associated beta strand protein